MDSIAIAGASPKGDCRPPLSTPFLALWSPCGPTSSAPSPSNRVDGDIKPHADPEVYTGVGIPGPCPARGYMDNTKGWTPDVQPFCVSAA